VSIPDPPPSLLTTLAFAALDELSRMDAVALLDEVAEVVVTIVLRLASN
jgi:hypothetical protein